MIFRQAITFTIVTTLSLSLMACAGGQGSRESRVTKKMEEADTNNDGFISRDEAKSLQRVEKNFDTIDANKDNQLSKDELMTFRNNN